MHLNIDLTQWTPFLALVIPLAIEHVKSYISRDEKLTELQEKIYELEQKIYELREDNLALRNK